MIGYFLKMFGRLRGICLLFLLAGMMCGCGSRLESQESYEVSSTSDAGFEKEKLSDDARLYIHIDRNGDICIPDPAKKQQEYNISLKCDYKVFHDSRDDETFYGDDSGTLFQADMEYLGLGTPVWISSCDVGCITGKTENVFTYDYSGKKKKERTGNCLVLIASAGADLSVEDEEEKYKNLKNYLIVLDYENHNIYTQEIILAEYPDNPQNVSMDINDISGDGRDDILVCRGGKSRSYSIWTYDGREGLHRIFDDREDAENMPYQQIKIRLLDDYKMKLSYPICGWKKTFSLTKDVGFPMEQLDRRQKKHSVQDDLFDEELPKWDQGKYIGDQGEFDTVPYLAMEYDDAWFEKTKDNEIRLVFQDYIALVHRDTVGDIYTYLKYDIESGKMVICDAEFKPEQYYER